MTPQEFADVMTMSGTKVSAWERIDRNLEQIVVGKIRWMMKHPDAENLTIVTVDIGTDRPIQCITAADNIKQGDRVPVALVGGKVDRLHDSEESGSDGVRIQRETIRGMVSEGVLCSVKELGFIRETTDDSPAYEIFVFDEEAEVGADAVKILGLSDVLFTIEPPSARKDC